MVNIYDNTLATSTNKKSGLAFISMFSFNVNFSDVCTYVRILDILALVSLKLLPKKRQINGAIDSLSGSYLLLFFYLQFVVFLRSSNTTFDKIFIKHFAPSSPILPHS